MLGESWKSVERGSCWWSVSVSPSQSVFSPSQSPPPLSLRSREEAGQLLVSVSSLDTVTIFSPSGISHPRNYFGIRSENHWSPDRKLFSLHFILEISQVQPFYYPGNNQGNVLKNFLKTQFSSSKIQWKNHAAAFPAVSHI